MILKSLSDISNWFNLPGEVLKGTVGADLNRLLGFLLDSASLCFINAPYFHKGFQVVAMCLRHFVLINPEYVDEFELFFSFWGLEIFCVDG